MTKIGSSGYGGVMMGGGGGGSSSSSSKSSVQDTIPVVNFPELVDGVDECSWRPRPRHRLAVITHSTNVSVTIE